MSGDPTARADDFGGRAAGGPAGPDGALDAPALDVPVPARTAPTGRVPVRAWLPSLIGLGLAAVVAGVLRSTNSLQASDDALVYMGFDPDRARLITALIVGALAAGIVAACAGRTTVAVLASVGAFGAAFAGTFRNETAASLASAGAQGTFDPLGWLTTVATLLVAAVIAGWAAATLTHVVRRYTVRAARDAGEAVRGRGHRLRGLARAASVVVVVALLAVTLPVFSDMVNYAPDVHMRQRAPVSGGLASGLSGGGQVAGTAGGGSQAGTAGGSSSHDQPASSFTGTGGPGQGSSGVTAGSLPGGLVPGPLAGWLITPGVLSSARPWAAHPPSGTGQVARITLPAPWTGGVATTANVDVYTPPGYGTGSTRYPVLYEAPYGLESWAKGVDIHSMLDGLITSGAIPPMIMVFASTYGGPYVDSECANTFDGREHFDTYMATKLVPYIDSHYPTIANAGARALVGASQGGYCSAALWSHNPTVFGTSIVFSGYFVSGVVSAETQNAARPFGNNAAYEAKQSPIDVVPNIPAAVAARSFVVLSASFTNPFFGPQLASFSGALAAAKVPMAIIPAPLGHSWQTQRDQLPTVLQMVAARMQLLGVLGPA